jgi:PAS domain S-box-containing protein
MAHDDRVSSIAARVRDIARSMGIPVDASSEDDVLALLDAVAARWQSSTARMQRMLDALYAIATLDFSHRLEILGDGSLSDAAAATINMLAEEMDASHRALGQRTAEARDQKLLLETVVNSMAEGVIVAGQQGDYLLVNPAARRLVGTDWSGANRRAGIFRPDRRTPFPVEEMPMLRALRGEATDDIEMFVCNERMPDGIELSVAGRPLIDETGQRRGGLIVFRDVTERNRAEAAQRRLAAVVEASNDAIVSYKLDGTISTWNAGAERLYQCTAEDAIGSTFARFTPPGEEQRWRTDILAAVARGEQVVNYEASRVRLDGSRILVAMSAAPISDARGAVIGVSAISRDVTVAKAMEHELKEARERAEQAARAKSQFLANMSHEIRTPLTAVLGFTDLLLDRTIGESERLNYVMTIRRNGEHLLSVINDVLDLSKIEAGAITVEQIECSPSAIVNDVASTMRVRATEKGLAFDVRFDTPIPARIHTDPTRLRQILLNLVSNAVKFTQRGHVHVVARMEQSALVFDVADTGIGLEPEQLEKIFRPFGQADASLTRRFGGTGLGLAISLPLANALGGTLHVTSSPGQGSTFTMRLPVTLQPDTPMATSPTDGRGSTHPSAGGPVDETPMHGRILIAEDGIDNQVLLSSILVRRGLQVMIAENGREAVDMALGAQRASLAFDLILMDMQMPELDGYGAAAQLRSAGYKRPIVALTAHALSGERERCLAAGCDDYLTKPIDRAVLLSTIRNYVTQPVEAAAPLHSALAEDAEMRDVIDGFVTRTHATAAALRTALCAGDVEQLRRTAHQLRGAGGGYGFPLLTEVAGRAEDALRSGLDSARASIEQLIDVCDRLRPGKDGDL